MDSGGGGLVTAEGALCGQPDGCGGTATAGDPHFLLTATPESTVAIVDGFGEVFVIF